MHKYKITHTKQSIHKMTGSTVPDVPAVPAVPVHHQYTTDTNTTYSASALPTNAQPAVTYLAFNPNDFYWNTIATFPAKADVVKSATALSVADITRLDDPVICNTTNDPAKTTHCMNLALWNNKALSQNAIQMQTKQTGNDEMYENMMDIYNVEIVKVINMSAGIAGILAYLYYFM